MVLQVGLIIDAGSCYLFSLAMHGAGDKKRHYQQRKSGTVTVYSTGLKGKRRAAWASSSFQKSGQYCIHDPKRGRHKGEDLNILY